MEGAPRLGRQFARKCRELYFANMSSKEAEKIQVIQAGQLPMGQWLLRVWNARKLLGSLAWRDLKVQYAQTFLGILWAAGQPLAGLVVFTVFFGHLVKVQVPGNVPYPLYAFTGMIAWFLMTYIVSRGGTSLVSNQELISRVEFPKLILPLTKVITGLFEALVTLVLLFGLMAILGFPITWRILFVPICLLADVILGLSVAVWLAALSIRFRDIQHIGPYVVNLAIWLTPVFYPSTLVPKGYELFLYLNPATAIVEWMRWSLLGTPMPSPWYALSAIPAVLLLISGLWYFRRIEHRIADEV